MSILDHALATAELGLRIFPLPPLAKKPPRAGWREDATTDPETIASWFRADPKINYGIRTGLANNLVVVDVDGADAERWWASHSLTSTARVSTPSGPDRTHYLFRIEDAEIQTNQSKIAPGVDIRAEDGYIVGVGSMLPTGTYSGDIRNIPDAPAALLDLVPDKQAFVNVQASDEAAEKVLEPSVNEQRQIADQVARLEALPKVWHEGAGWHQVVFRACCHFSRMVNSEHYALTQDGALSILTEATPFYPEWPVAHLMEQWNSARKTTAGQAAAIPAEAIPNFLSIVEVTNSLPEFASTGESFMDMIIGEPEIRTPGALWAYRKTILVEGFRAGLSPEQVATLGWNAAASRTLQSDMNGVETLWGEVQKARAIVEAERGEGYEPPPADERAPLVLVGPERISLMTEDERTHARTIDWFGSQYMAWAEESVSVMNAPYHEINYWAILALIFAPHGVIPLAGGISSPCNLYVMTAGDTTTGKSEARRLMKTVLQSYYTNGDTPNIGGNASPNALLEALIERDGKSSWFNSDEAHGHIKAMRQGGWLAGLPEILTELYDGDVPIILRNGKKDVSGVDAKTFFTMQYTGTMTGISSALLQEDWESGFATRFVFAIGEKQERTRESMRLKIRRGKAEAGVDSREMQKYWGASFGNAITGVRAYAQDGGPVDLDISQEVEDRHNELIWTLSQMTDGHRNETMLKPTFARFSFSILKCACLAAMVQGRFTVTLDDYLLGLLSAEGWAGNIVAMVDSTTSTELVRKVNDLERFVAAQRNRTVKIERVYGHFNKDETRDIDAWIDRLKKEGRMEKNQVTGGGFELKVKEQPMEVIAA